MSDVDPDRATVSPDERAAMRAYLQRCEVRLSTVHRVATALLSGAGILVLLPAVERDTVLQVIRALLAGPVSWSRGLLLAAVVLSIVLALVVLWLVIIELTRFYFHANHVMHADGEVFSPRFTLTGLRFPSDEFDAATDALYADRHNDPDTVRLLVPGNERARNRIDQQIAAYPGLLDESLAPDEARASALFELAASRRRPLVEEVIKVEYGMVRHMQRIQVVVLRYVKALMVIVVTALASFATAAAVNGRARVSVPSERWIAGAMLIWAPVALIVVASPVRWLEKLLRSEGAQKATVARDRELTELEEVTGRIVTVAWACAMAAMITLLVHHPVSAQGKFAVVAVMGVSTVAFATAVARHFMRRPKRRGS